MFKEKVLKLKTVNEWAANNKKNFKPQRDKVKICMIDDTPMNTSELNKMGYTQVRIMDAYGAIEDTEPYDVILCDIKGIGEKIDPVRQGIAVALDIKKMHPEKVVIQFSGQKPEEFDSDFKYNNMMIDGFIEKGKSTKDLVDKLDEICDAYWNPIKAWKFAERNLRREDNSNKVIAYLEDAYVKSLEKNKDYIKVYKEKMNGADLVNMSVGILNFLSQILAMLNNIK